MKAADIRRRFLEYFEARGHRVLPSASLVPADDPTLLFTNAGMVQFKQVFLGVEPPAYPRATTAQKVVRAGGKHNDLEEVGVTARHHTFFEMLGNFSFGDYFKREAILFAWEFLTVELGLDRSRLFATVHYTDDEALELWRDEVGLEAGRILRFGDKDNFWQMADTGPCGPCSELHYDLRSDGGEVSGAEEFEALGHAGRMLELWNLVFMQFDRDEEGNLAPLPAPSIDTGAGLERLAAVLQGVDSNYDTDLFLPLLDRVARVVERPYEREGPEGVSYRVLSDHARSVAFLLADGVLPSNEGRGYVLRRILRRGVRHAWLLGMREPALVEVVDEVTRQMGDAYPELRERGDQIAGAVRQEEERFFATIEGGMERFDAVAPDAGEVEAGAPRTVSGAEAFKLYDTFGFPLDLTELMARERGYSVDVEGFEAALEAQRARSRADREGSRQAMDRGAYQEEWTRLDPDAVQRWVGWDAREAETTVLALVREDGRVGLVLRDNPFYVEAGGQVSDVGLVEGEGWSLRVDDVRKVGDSTAVLGRVEGELPSAEEIEGGALAVRAQVAERERHNTERNHTATHLLHAALRKVLGEHVAQRGSLVAPERLRFDFSHTDPLTAEEIAAVEREVNAAIWDDLPVRWEITSRDAAVERGAMALFGEKYGAEVRLVEVPGVSLELCGGCHLRHTGEAGLFVVTRESGVAAGVRRIEALTGPAAFEHLRGAERELDTLSGTLKVDRAQIEKRIEGLLEERNEMEELLRELRRGGGGVETPVHEADVPMADGSRVRYRALRMRVKDADDARAFGDAFRENEAGAVAAVAAEAGDGTVSLFVFVTDDLIGRGVRAGALVKEIAAVTGGRGGGRPHMAQGGVEDPERVDEALKVGEGLIRQALEATPA